MISKNIINEIKRKAHDNIVDVIASYVPLKKKGSNFWSLSPFAKEKTASFSVNPTRGAWRCFSSSIGGNAVDFIIAMERCNFIEAIKILAAMPCISVVIPEIASEIDLALDNLNIVSNVALKHFIANRNSDFQEYTKERGISQESIDFFEIGFAKNEWQSLSSEIEKAYSVESAIQVGLVGQKTKLYDLYRNRIIFPIRNGYGKLVGFGGRILGKKTENEPKYINSPDSKLYNKKNILYGLYYAKKAIKELGFIRLTEGYTDVIALYQNGFQNTVCSCGTAFTPEQAALIRKHTTNVLLVYDSDSAGQKANLKAIDILVQYGIDIKICVLPAGEDPDSYIKKYGKEKYAEIESKALSIVEYSLGNKTGIAAEDKAKIETIAETIAKMPTTLDRELYSKEVASQMQVDTKAVLELVNKKISPIAYKHTPIEFIQKQANIVSRDISEIMITEMLIIELMCKYGETQIGENTCLMDFIVSAIENVSFSNELNEIIRKCLISQYRNECPYSIEYIQSISKKADDLSYELNSLDTEIQIMQETGEKTEGMLLEIAKNTIIDYIRSKEFSELQNIVESITENSDYQLTKETVKGLFNSIKDKENRLSKVKYILC